MTMNLNNQHFQKVQRGIRPKFGRIEIFG